MIAQQGATHDTIYGTYRRVMTTGGIRNLWRGNLTNCIRVFPHKSILFGLNEFLLKHFKTQNQIFSFVTGGAAGLVATTTIYPITVIRANLTGTFDARSNSMIGIGKHIVQESGIKGLYRGFIVTCIGTIPYEAIRIGVYGMARSHIPLIDTKYGHQPHPIGKLCAGAISGATAAIVTYPTDTTRRMMQVQSAEGMKVYNGLLDCVKSNLKEGGVARFYYGISAKIIRVVPDAAILFLAYESLKDLLHDVY